MKAVILAAGKGSRLNARTAACPKPLIRIQDTPLLDLNLTSLLKQKQVEEILIITGHQADQIENHVSNTWGSEPRIHLLHCPEYAEGNLLTLMTARTELTGAFLLTNADHVFSDRLWEHFLSSTSDDQVTAGCYDDRLPGGDEMKVQTSTEGVTAISKTLSDFHAGYLGLTHVGKACKNLYWEKADQLFNAAGLKTPVERVLLALAVTNKKPRPCMLNGHPWFEVDTEEDLTAAASILERF